MAGNRPARGGVLETMAEFSDRRMRDIASWGSAAEAAAHKAYGDALRSGTDLVLRTQGEVNRLGAKLLGDNKAVGKPAPRQSLAPRARLDPNSNPTARIVSGGMPGQVNDALGGAQRGFLGKLDLMPRPSRTVTIGGQVYGEVDNGRANVLVPADDPLASPALRAQQRQSVDRVLYMLDHPLGGAAYTLATIANAPQGVRDSALLAGGMADVAMLGGAGRKAGRNWPIASERQPDGPTSTRPSVRYGALNAKGQATGVTTTLTADLLGGGSRADRRITPPGWQGNGTRYNESRGHLYARQLGGTGADMRNLMTLTQYPTNSPQMSNFERDVLRRVNAGEVVDYSVTPLYGDAALAPAAVLQTALGSRGQPAARVIENPAGTRK